MILILLCYSLEMTSPSQFAGDVNDKFFLFVRGGVAFPAACGFLPCEDCVNVYV